MFCRNCGKQISENANFCPNCAAQQNNHPVHNITASQNNTQAPNGARKAKPGFLKFFISFAAICALIFVFTLLFRGSKLKLGKTTDEANAKIPASGGIVKVENENSVINGLSIVIEDGTYESERSFEIKATEINGHGFGNEFNPVTPLISIDNGHEFGKRPMKVTVPINIHADEFAMGFYIDKKSSRLEALPFESYSTTHITLLTNHFSDIIISKISISELEKLSVDGSVSADTGFEPGKDDWQFINYGSALAPGGHCAGQSLTMSWYYYDKHIKGEEPRLYGRFDNNGGSKTNDFWEDDSDSYRFASVVQNNINWEGQEFHNYLSFSSQDQKKVFYAFAYAMQITRQPQFMGIYSFDSQGNKTGGHAIVAYKVEKGKIYVADPNYPGQKDRYCELDAEGFKPYSSGANAADISANGAVLYKEMHFIASSALIDFGTISSNYTKMLDGSIGDNEFPSTDFEIMTKYSSDLSAAVFSPLKETVSLGKEYMDALPAEMKNQILIRITPKAPMLIYSLYQNNSTTPVQNPVVDVFENSIYFEIAVKEGANDIAFLVEQEINDNYSYVDFVRLKVNYGQLTATPTQTPPPTMTPKPTQTQAPTMMPKPNKNNLLSKLPGEYELTYIGGVGAPGSENTSIVSETYIFYEDGTYTFRGVRKDTDPVTFTSTWTLKGDILTIGGVEYRFNGTTIEMISSYPWTYTKK